MYFKLVGTMKTVTFLLGICLTTVYSLPRQQERIVGGTVTSIDRYPFATSLQVTSNHVNFGHTCGGTIINNRSILSAIHCWMTMTETGFVKAQSDNLPKIDAFMMSACFASNLDFTSAEIKEVKAASNNNVANRYRIRVGSTNRSSGGRLHNVAQLIGHAQYNPRNHDTDIGVVRVSTAIPLGSATIRAGSLAGANLNIPDNSNVIAIGWERTSHNGAGSEQLRHVTLRAVNQVRCNTDFRGIITANMLCIGWSNASRGTCFGDSGTAAVFNNIVVGVASFLHWDGCDSHWPGVYARVSRYTAWIRNNS